MAVKNLVHLVPPDTEPHYDRLWELAERIAEEREALVRDAVARLDQGDAIGARAALMTWLGASSEANREAERT